MSINDLSRTIKPKSDQLNYDDLLAGPITVAVQDIGLTGADDQPISIVIGNGYQPYKPCKSMRKLLIFCWGKDGSQWIGRSMTLFGDPSVKWAGQAVGGIRISHLSDISQDLSLSLTETRGKRKPYLVKRLTSAAPQQRARQQPQKQAEYTEQVQQVSLPPEAQKLLSLLEDCQNMDDLNAWVNDASSKYPQGTFEGDALANAYLEKANLFSQNQ